MRNILIRVRPVLVPVALLILPLLVFVLVRPERGLIADYGMKVKSKRIPAAVVTDTDLYFMVPELFQAPVRNNWNSGKFPSAPTTLDVTWQGFARVPADGKYIFSSVNHGKLTLSFDNRAIQIPPPGKGVRVPLEKGVYRFSAHYVGIEGPRLQWKREGTQQRAVPIDLRYFYRTKPLPGAGIVAIFGFVALLLVQLLLLRRFAPFLFSETAAFLRARWVPLTLLLLLLLTLNLRLYRYDRMPYPVETRDEFNAVLNGLNLAYRGVPQSWSLLNGYRANQKQVVTMFGNRFLVVEPHFDNPPGFDLLVGGYLRLRGADFNARYTRYFTKLSRHVPIAFGVLTALLIFFFSKRLFLRDDVALAAVLIFAVFPPAVFAGRLVKAENALAPLLLAALIFTMRYLDAGRRADLILAAVIAGISCTFKATGVTIVGSVMALLLVSRKWKDAVVVGAIGSAFFGLYFLYGAAYDWDTFVRVFKSQSNREFIRNKNIHPITPQGLFTLATLTKAVKSEYFVLTGLWMWLSTAMFCFSGKWSKSRRTEPMAWPVMVYLVFMAASVTSTAVYGWYAQPFWPFFAVAGAWFIWRMLRTGDALMVTLFCLFPLYDALYWGLLVPATHDRTATRLIQMAPISLLLAAYLLPEDKRKTATRLLAGGAVVIAFGFTVIAVYRRWYVFGLPW